jgi:mono/diheme cytochrome c family protein
MLRKPYVIGRWMYSNGVRVPYALKIDREGYLAHSNWVWNGADTSYSRGEAIFRGECGACHTLNGYRPLAQLLAGRDRANIESFITMLHEYKPDSPYHHFMPPMVGTKQDVEDLTDFLNAQVNPPAPSAPKPLQTAQK